MQREPRARTHPGCAARRLGALFVAALPIALACSDEAVPPEPNAVRTDEAPSMQREPTAPPPSEGDVAGAYATELAREPVDTDWSGGSVGRGAGLYASHCAVCHGGQGKGDGPAAVALNPKPRDFSTGTFYIDADADNRTGEPVDLARVILEGPGAFGGSPVMGAWKEVLDEDQVRDLVAFIRQLSGSGDGAQS